MLLPRRVATAPSGIISSSNRLISHNDRYYMYGSPFSLYFYKIPEMTLYTSLNLASTKFHIAHLNPVIQNSLFVITSDNKILLINVETKKIVSHAGSAGFPVLEVCFSSSGRYIIIFYEGSSVVETVDIETNKGRVILLGAETPRLCTAIPRDPSMYLICDIGNNMYTLNIETLDTKLLSLKGEPYCVKFDPLNSMNCLFVTEKCKWVFVVFSNTVKLITACERNDIEMSSGDWIPCMPGHILTGDKNHGIVYAWAVASGKMVFSQEIEETGVMNIMCISPHEFAIAFASGALGVYDVQKRTYTTVVPKAHTHAVFDGAFHPTDSDIFATAGGDGKVCFWSLPTLTQQPELALKDTNHALLCIAFSNGGSYLATGSDDGYVTIYNVKTGAIHYKEQVHSMGVVSVDWCPTNPNYLATSSHDKYCYIIDVTKKSNVIRIITKRKLQRLKWANDKGALAIACTDGSLYVRLDGGTYFIIKGSNNSLFDVAWSPFDPDLVAATDDGGNVLLFNIASKTSKCAPGHEGKVRPIAWSTTQRNLLMSGGYDGTVCFWDTTTMNLLSRFVIHSSYVYSISVHPMHPTHFVTTSADRTVQLWSTTHLFPDCVIKDLLDGVKFIGAKYSPSKGCNNLLNLIHRITRDEERISFKEGEIVHVRDLLRIYKKFINKNLATVPNDPSRIIKNNAYKQTVINAANKCLYSGNIKKYCELMFICGNYDEALAAAPAVSYSFWQSLSISKAQLSDNKTELENAFLYTGQPMKAVDEMMKNECYNSALLVAASIRTSNFQPKTKSVFVKCREESEGNKYPFIKDDFTAEDYMLYIIASERSAKLAKEGTPLLSAASLLSIGDVDGAIWRLIHAGEITWGVDLAKAVDRFDNKIAELIFKYCCYNNKGHEAFKLLPAHMKRSFAPLLSFQNEAEQNAFYKENGMRSIQDYVNESRSSHSFTSISAKILSGRVEEGVAQAVECVKRIMESDLFDFTEANKYVDYIRNAAAHVDTSKTVWMKAVALCHYFGVYNALWHNYGLVAPTICNAFKANALAVNEEWLTRRIDEVTNVATLALIRYDVSKAPNYIADNDVEITDTVKSAMNIMSVSDNIDGGCTVTPTCIGITPYYIDLEPTTSICTGEPIPGNPFILEDGKTRMALNEAYMYFESTPFSPLKTAKYIIPY